MVDAICAAAARVLIREGYEGASTNRIAETAGVSVGSLYQYFPSKEAIVAVLIERHADEMWEVFVARTAAVWDRPLAEAIPGVIDALMCAHRIDPKLHRVLHEQVPRVGQLGRMREVNRRAVEVATRFLDARRDELAVADVRTAAWVVVEAVEALIHGCTDDRAIDADRVRNEASTLVLHYLTGRDYQIAAAAMNPA